MKYEYDISFSDALYSFLPRQSNESVFLFHLSGNFSTHFFFPPILRQKKLQLRALKVWRRCSPFLFDKNFHLPLIGLQPLWPASSFQSIFPARIPWKKTIATEIIFFVGCHEAVCHTRSKTTASSAAWWLSAKIHSCSVHFKELHRAVVTYYLHLISNNNQLPQSLCT